MMLNARKGSSNLKAEIGEILAKYNTSRAHRTRELTPEFLDKISIKIPADAKNYLKKYFYSIDIFRFRYKNQKFELELFEVKTMTVSKDKLKNNPTGVIFLP